MKRIIYIVPCALVAALLLAPVMLLASTTTDATYTARIDIRNNGTAITGGYVNLSLDSQSLISDGYTYANMTNSAVIGATGADVAYMPAPNSTDMWMIYVPSIAENVTINNNLYLGGPAMGG